MTVNRNLIIAAICLCATLVGYRFESLKGRRSVALAWPGRASNVGEIRRTSPMTQRRFSHTATLLRDGRVLIAGGLAANGEYLSSAELFDPATNRFQPTGSMTIPRAGHIAIRLPDGRVLIAGGSAGRRFENGRWQGDLQASAEFYDPKTGRFAPAAARLTEPRDHPTVTDLPGGAVLIAGGEGPDAEILRTAEVFDPKREAFSRVGDMTVPRAADAAAPLGDGRVLVVGGVTGGHYPNEKITASAEIYDPASRSFSSTGGMAVARYKLGAVCLADGRVLVAGGSDNRAWEGRYSSAEIYDPETGRFTEIGSMHEARFKLGDSLVRLAGGPVLIGGGAADAELFEPAADSFRLIPGSVDDCRFFSRATQLADGRVLLTGGYGEHAGRGGVHEAFVWTPKGS
jgi:Galactose oxidase, central domain/Kelch motif